MGSIETAIAMADAAIDAGPKIADVLSTVPLDQKIICKHMTLRGESRDGWYR